MKFSLFFLLIIFSFSVKAQIYQTVKKFSSEFSLINPAAAGTKEKALAGISSFLFYNKEDNHILSSNFLYGFKNSSSDKITLGGFLMYENFRPVTITGGTFTFAYHHSLSGDKIVSAGSSVSIQDAAYKQELFLSEENQSDILSPIHTVFSNADFGILLHSKKWKTGVSVSQIFRDKLILKKSSEQRIINPERRITGSFQYEFELNSDFTAEPLIMPHIDNEFYANAHLELKLNYKDRISISGIYDTEKFTGAKIAFISKKIQLGYGFLFRTSKLSDHSIYHQIFVKFDFSKKEETNKI